MTHEDEAIVKSGPQGFSALAPGGPKIGIPGQFLRNIAPGALHRARRGESPIFEGEPGSEDVPTGVKVTVDPPARPEQLPLPTAAESEPEEPPAELPESEPDEEVIDVEPVDAPDAEPVEPLKEE